MKRFGGRLEMRTPADRIGGELSWLLPVGYIAAGREFEPSFRARDFPVFGPSVFAFLCGELGGGTSKPFIQRRPSLPLLEDAVDRVIYGGLRFGL
jgi:hypothetical protein